MVTHNQYAMIEALIPNWPVLISRDEMERIIQGCAEHVFLHLDRAPIHLWLVVKFFYYFTVLSIAMVNFKWSFAKVDLAFRQSYLAKFSNKFALFQLYIRLLRSLTMLSFMEHPLVKEKYDF